MVTNTHITNSALRADLPYDAIKDFSPVARMGTSFYTLSVHPSVPANSVKELIELAKQKPGQLTFGDAGIGGGPHMASERFKMMAGINTKIVHFKGGAASVTGVLGGEVTAAFNGGGIALTHSKAGKLKLLATTGTKRFWPDIPIIAETLPGFSTDFIMGINAPAGTPTPIVDRLAKEIKAVMETDEARKLFEAQGAMIDYLGPSEFGKYLEDELANYVKVVKAANIKLQD
jgi:tripartite-type tricarboxylate transporter receptor subunit TctC